MIRRRSRFEESCGVWTIDVEEQDQKQEQEQEQEQKYQGDAIPVGACRVDDWCTNQICDER
jgi:hypothetical protein